MAEKDSRDQTILIVEDSDDARYFMRLALEDLGYLIIEAEDGAKGVQLAQQERPDIILMDLSLPVMDGIAATEKIRACDGLSKVPIVAVTAPVGRAKTTPIRRCLSRARRRKPPPRRSRPGPSAGARPARAGER